MAHISFDRADIEGFGALGKDSGQRANLNWIAEGGAGAMRFDVTNLRWLEIGIGQRPADHPRLGWAIRYGQPATGAILVDRTAADHSEDGITIGLRISQPFQNDDPTAFAAHIAIGGGIKSFTMRVRREHVATGEHRRKTRIENHIDAAGKCRVTFPLAQTLTGEVNRGQRRGAGGVNRHGGASQPQQVREPPRSGAGGVAGGDVEIVLDLGAEAGIAADAITDEDANLCVE